MMTAARALGSESAPQRGSGIRLRIVAGIVAGMSTAAVIMLLCTAPPAPPAPPAPTTRAIVAATSVVSVSAESSPVPHADDLTELWRKDLKAHHAAIERHMREPGDPAWAPASEKSLREFLRALPTHAKYRVTLVDCRTTSCVAELSLASYAVAREIWHSVLEATNPMGCGTAVTLEEPKEGAKSYEVSVIYDCTKARSARVAASNP